MSDDAARRAPRRRAGDAAGTHPRVGSARVGSFGRGAPAPARIASGFAREGGREGEMTHLVHGQRLDPRGGLPSAKMAGGTCRRRRCRLRRRRRLGDRRSGRRLRRGDRRSGRHLPAGHRTRLCRSPRLGPSRSPGRRHFGSRRRGRGLGPTRGRSPSRCRRRRAGEGEVRHVGWCGSSARASPVCDAEG